MSGSPPETPSDTLYYVHDGQNVLGPMKVSAVQAMVANGALTADSDINKVGDNHWMKLSQLNLVSTGISAPVAAWQNTGARQGLGGFVYVGFWLRLAAYLIDVVLVYLLSTVAGFLFGVIVGLIFVAVSGQDQQTLLSVARIGGGLIGLILGIIYFAGFLASRWQATPGKKILGLYVIRTDGRRIGFALGLGRYFANFLSSIILCIGYLMIFWTDEHKALHDMVCGTRVVRGKPGAHEGVVDAF